MRKLIKYFTFSEYERELITLSDSDKIRLNTEDVLDMRIQLKEAEGSYSTDNDIHFKTWITNPKALKKISGFEIIGSQPEGTSLGVRISNGTDEFYYNTTANEWQVSTTEWNTETEIRANLSSYLLTTTQVGFIINLKTTDSTVTPTVNEIKFLGDFDIDILQDAWESLFQKIHDELRVVTDILVSIAEDTDEFDLGVEYKLDNQGYNFTNAVAVYNKTDDPSELINLLDSYTPGAQNADGETNAPGKVKTSVVIPAGKIIRIKMEYVPEVADHTDEDYYEINKVPLIAIESVDEIKRDALRIESNMDGDFIRDIENGTAVQVQPSAHIDLRFEYAMFAKLSMDQKRLAEAFENFLSNNPLFKSLGLDHTYGLDPQYRFSSKNKGTSGNLLKATGYFDVRGITLYSKPSKIVPLVKRVNVEITT
jgi:hypothetical protein